MDELSDEQIQILDDMVKRRMENTGESRRDACLHINKFLIRRAAGLSTQQPFN